MLVIPSWESWGSFLNRMSGRICSYGYSHSASHTWCDLLPRGGLLIEGDRDRNHHGAIPVCYTSHPGSSVYLYMGFNALLPEHGFLHVVVHILHSLMWRNLSLKVLYAFLYVVQCGIPWSGYCCRYSTTAVPFLLQKQYVRCMLACSSFWPPLAATATTQDSVLAGMQ